MDAAPKKNWWQRSWTFPASVLLHVLIVGTFYLQWPGSNEAPAEPESVSVELVEPPKEKPPAKAEEQKTEQPPPPPPSPPVPPIMPNVAVRPDGTQLDERDEVGKQEDEGGKEQPRPAKNTESVSSEESKPAANADAQPPAEAPAEESKPIDEAVQPASELKATAADGEIAASETPADQQPAAVAVPLPRPERPNAATHENAPSGAGDPNLKPAKKLLASGERPRPMRRQILGDLPPLARVAQLCIAETMAQIRDSRGDYLGLKPHTGKDFPVVGNVMNAHGAFNVGNNWYPINYRCEVDIEKYIVTDFRFDIGSQFTPQDIKRLNLHGG